MSPLASLPAAWRSVLSDRTVQQIRSGLSGASVFRVQGPSGPKQFLKIAAGEYAGDLRQEIERTKWLGSQRIHVPVILDAVIEPQLTAVLMTALDGESVEESSGRPDEIVDAIGRGLAQLHGVPVALCPFDESLRVRLSKAQADVAGGIVDSNEFDERNRGVSPLQLLTRLMETVPNSEDIVIVHGDATFTNILIGSGGILGFVDCGRCGKADRYVDLAVIAWEVENHFGPEWIDRFFRGYGLEDGRDREKCRFYSDLYELF